MAQYDVNNCSVSSLLTNIKDGSIAIPEIQRPFVWDASKVRDLIDSLYHGYGQGKKDQTKKMHSIPALCIQWTTGENEAILLTILTIISNNI